MKSKTKIWIIAASGLAALLLINYKVMPYWALVHSPSRIDGVYQELMTTNAETVAIPAVDAIFMGWKWFLLILVPVAGTLWGLGYYLGSIVREDEIKHAADEKVNKILSEKRVTATGVIIQGFKAEEIEQTLRREYRKLSEEQEKMQYARKLFYEESAQFAEFVSKARQSAGYPGRMRLHHSGKPASDIIVTNRSAVTRGSSNSNKYREADHDQS